MAQQLHQPQRLHSNASASRLEASLTIAAAAHGRRGRDLVWTEGARKRARPRWDGRSRSGSGERDPGRREKKRKKDGYKRGNRSRPGRVLPCEVAPPRDNKEAGGDGCDGGEEEGRSGGGARAGLPFGGAGLPGAA